jgi:transposase
MVKHRRTYDQEFKLEAVRLVTEGDRKITEVARDLGIDRHLIHNWRAQYLRDGNHAFPGKGHQRPAEEELRRLKKELADVSQERDILKKALAIFSKHPE